MHTENAQNEYTALKKDSSSKRLSSIALSKYLCRQHLRIDSRITLVTLKWLCTLADDKCMIQCTESSTDNTSRATCTIPSVTARPVRAAAAKQAEKKNETLSCKWTAGVRSSRQNRAAAPHKERQSTPRRDNRSVYEDHKSHIGKQHDNNSRGGRVFLILD